MNQNVVVVLVALAFGAIGFSLGRVTCCCPPPGACCAPTEGCEKSCEHSEVRIIHSDGEDDVQVLIDGLLNDGFEGDTTLVIPGGTAMVSSHDGEVRVEVEMEQSDENGSEVHKEVTVTIED